MAKRITKIKLKGNNIFPPNPIKQKILKKVNQLLFAPGKEQPLTILFR